MRLMAELGGPTRLPLRNLTPPREMSSVVPVAMAMLPEKVEHEAMAVASPWFWTVVVPETLQAAVVVLLARVSWRFRRKHTLCGTGSGQSRESKLDDGRHYVAEAFGMWEMILRVVNGWQAPLHGLRAVDG